METGKSTVAIDAAFERGPATVGIKTKVAASGKVSGTEASCQMAVGDMTVAGKYELDKSGKVARLRVWFAVWFARRRGETCGYDMRVRAWRGAAPDLTEI